MGPEAEELKFTSNVPFKPGLVKRLSFQKPSFYLSKGLLYKLNYQNQHPELGGYI
jgi:hypothetical protein